jgi:hypothetical protein
MTSVVQFQFLGDSIFISCASYQMSKMLVFNFLNINLTNIGIKIDPKIKTKIEIKNLF